MGITMNKKELGNMKELISHIMDIKADIVEIKITSAVQGEKITSIEKTLSDEKERDLHTRTSNLETKMNYVVTGILGAISTALMSAWDTITHALARLFT